MKNILVVGSENVVEKLVVKHKYTNSKYFPLIMKDSLEKNIQNSIVLDLKDASLNDLTMITIMLKSIKDITDITLYIVPRNEYQVSFLTKSECIDNFLVD